MADALPLVRVERVQLQFAATADFVAAQVANNVLVLGLANGKLLRIDLDHPADIDSSIVGRLKVKGLIRGFTDADIDVPKYHIRRLFLDPTASHLIISTTGPDNLYLHISSRQPRVLPRFKGVVIESVAWNPAKPTNATRDILIAAADGNLYETAIEPTGEFYRSLEKYLKSVWKAPTGPICGAFQTTLEDKRQFLLATPQQLLLFSGTPSGSFFEKEAPSIVELDSAAVCLSVGPDSFACLYDSGICHGAWPVQQFTTIPVETMSTGVVSEWHCLSLHDRRLQVFRLLDRQLVFDDVVLEPDEVLVGLQSDVVKNTYWLFTARDIYEIVLTDEDRAIWQVYLGLGQYELAKSHAKSPHDQATVAAKWGDRMMEQNRFVEASELHARSNRAFEHVVLQFIDHQQYDPLRNYVWARLARYPKKAKMQRTMLACWLVELFMAKLDLSDTSQIRNEETKCQDEYEKAQSEWVDFLHNHHADLDPTTVYEIIGSHGRDSEMLAYARVINDARFVTEYWVQREKWDLAIDAVKRSTEPDLFYTFAQVLMTHRPIEMVDVLIRQDLNPVRLVPALLSYSQDAGVSLAQNQAVRYLQFCINSMKSRDVVVHHALISIFATDPSPNESALLKYLESWGEDAPYDANFAFRLCIQHDRIQSAVYLYSSLGEYTAAVHLALQHGEIDLAGTVADRTESSLRKRLWLEVARVVICPLEGHRKSEKARGSLKKAIEFLKRCNVLRIEDLIPLFPDFVVIDDFKEEICEALETYSRSIADLEAEMDSSARTAVKVKTDIGNLSKRYALVEPGEGCHLCELPLLARQFFVFPSCQHGFHSDCLGTRVLERSRVATQQRMRDLQKSMSQRGLRYEADAAELDQLISSQCVLCGEMAIAEIEAPFVDDW